MVFLASGLEGISPALAVLAGLASFVSPCVLPLVPAYLAYLGARAAQPAAVTAIGPAATPSVSSSPSVATAGLAFVAGLSVIFILFFYVFSLAVQPIRAYVPACFTVVAGPIGASGPDAFTDHTFANLQSLASNYANAQKTAGGAGATTRTGTPDLNK